MDLSNVTLGSVLVVKIIRLVPNCGRPQTTDIGWLAVILAYFGVLLILC